MASTKSSSRPPTAALLDLQHPYRSLAVVFGLWKAFLLAIAVVATWAGPAYDTSGDLLGAAENTTAAYTSSPAHIISGGLVSRLTSWDAIYYVQAARRGHVYEQEWAFGAGLPLVVSFLKQGLATVGLDAPVAAVAVVYVHAAHLLAVFALYKLGRQVWVGSSGQTTAFVAACLHILSPAGLFLSSPYAESSCALFSFVGLSLFAAGRKEAQLSVKGDILRLLAGVSFGVATLFRSNGLLNGIVFAYEAVAGGLTFLQKPSLALFRRLAFVGLGGLAVAAGSIVPQAVAYSQYCTQPSSVPGEEYRPWCTERLPSIYNFVQEHYWGAGKMFNYWTLSNLPLFVLAAPMLAVMARSGVDLGLSAGKKDANGKPSDTGRVVDPQQGILLQCMAAAQLLLAVMAFTSYHVQIISRLSSAYPVWYWWLAQGLSSGHKSRSKLAGGLVVFMVMYASIQGILFASFLPPA